MKELFIFFLAIFILKPATAQLDLASSFNSTYSGRNVSLSLAKTWNEKNDGRYSCLPPSGS